MKKCICFRLMLVVILLTGSISVSAYDFKVDRICYNIISVSDLTVEVTETDQKNEYSGDMVIPSTVTYNGKTLNVTRIGRSAFYNCYGLISVTISAGVKSIERYAFSRCTILTSITIPESVTSIEGYAFEECARLSSIIIPNSVTSIGIWAFHNCTGLTSTTISNSITGISDYTFYNCTRLKSVTIPSRVTSIGRKAFSGCTKLDSVTIGKNVTSIDEEAFSKCTALTSIYCLNPTPCEIDGSAIEQITYLNATLYVPTNSVAAYQRAYGWKNFYTIVGKEPSSVSQQNINALNVYAKGNKIAIENGNPLEVITIYNASGTLIKTIKATDSYIEVELPQNEIYLIRTADKTMKVRL